MTHHMKRGLMGIVKNIDPDRPVKFAQADHNGNFSLLADFPLLSDNSTLLNCQFEIIKPYQPVLASFPFLLFVSRSSKKVAFHVTNHNCFCPACLSKADSADQRSGYTFLAV